MDDVELWPFTEAGLLLLGPGTHEVLRKLGLQDVGPLSVAEVACNLCRKVMITTPSFHASSGPTRSKFILQETWTRILTNC